MLKVVEFESFEAFEESGLSGKFEVVTIVKGGSHGKKHVCADLMTECKSYKTAIRRFFKALEGDSRFDGWREGIEESCENGYFADKEQYWESGKGLVYTGGYHWCVEDHDGSYYVELTVVTDEEDEGQETAQAASAPLETDTTSTLTEEEVKFFNDTVARIKYSVNVRVPIEPMNHEQLTGTNKEALGICWAEDDGTGKPVPFRITIDEFFIHECYVYENDPFAVLRPASLEQVIAHEIAHLHVWRHGKKHTALTEHICRLIEKGEPHGMGDSGPAPQTGAGGVTMAAMQPIATEQQEGTIEIINDVSEEDMRWFSAHYPHHNVVGFMREAHSGGGSITRIILKTKPGHKGWTPYGAARDCGDHYIVARYSQYDLVDKKTLAITRDVDDK